MPEQEELSEMLKAKANDFYVKGNFPEAYKLYSQAINSGQSDKNLLSVLYCNRSASRYSMENYTEALEDANYSLELNSAYTKAYMRKAMALIKLNDEYQAYKTWIEALKKCETSVWLNKQAKEAKLRWSKFFTKVPIASIEDLLERFVLIEGNTRLKLSTLAHFWNLSSEKERLEYFKTFLTLIGGESNLSEETQQLFSSEKMIPMPMHNYEDLPIENIQPWCQFLENLQSDKKCELLKQMWELLTSFEQNLVIVDLKTFLTQNLQKDILDESDILDNNFDNLNVNETNK
jgi:hypothetical protein